MTDAHDRFFVRMESGRAVRLTIAEMTVEDLLRAVAFQECELVLMERTAEPSLALLQRVAAGDGTMTRRELREAELTAATLVRVQQQTTRLREAIRQFVPVG